MKPFNLSRSIRLTELPNNHSSVGSHFLALASSSATEPPVLSVLCLCIPGTGVRLQASKCT